MECFTTKSSGFTKIVKEKTCIFKSVHSSCTFTTLKASCRNMYNVSIV